MGSLPYVERVSLTRSHDQWLSICPGSEVCFGLAARSHCHSRGVFHPFKAVSRLRNWAAVEGFIHKTGSLRYVYRAENDDDESTNFLDACGEVNRFAFSRWLVVSGFRALNTDLPKTSCEFQKDILPV